VKRTGGLLALSASLALVGGACGGPASAGPMELTVFAAASLRDAIVEVERSYEAATPGLDLVVATDSSTTLRAQIEQGAPADLFLAADDRNPAALAHAGLADGPPVAFAANWLTIIVPSDNPGRIETPRDLARDGVRVIAAGDEVPISRYAAEAVTRLAALPDYPADFAQRYVANVVSREENVRAVVARIELGEGDAAIVYQTDARAATGTVDIAIPDEANIPATYTGVVIAASAQSAAAHALLAWLAGPDGRAVLASFGFGSPR